MDKYQIYIVFGDGLPIPIGSFLYSSDSAKEWMKIFQWSSSGKGKFFYKKKKTFL